MNRITGTEEGTLRERFGGFICQFQPQLQVLFVVEIIVLTLAVFSLLFVPPGTPSHLILLVDFVLLGVTMVPTVGILYLCNRRS